jgi:hypothetical protein
MMLSLSVLVCSMSMSASNVCNMSSGLDSSYNLKAMAVPIQNGISRHDDAHQHARSIHVIQSVAHVSGPTEILGNSVSHPYWLVDVRTSCGPKVSTQDRCG